MTLLELKDVQVSYGRIRALHGVSLNAAAGQVTVLLGANGAGKTTTLRAISGMVKTSGQVTFKGSSIRGMRPDRIARGGIAHVVQGRGTFVDLDVEDNLRAGAYRVRDRAQIETSLALVYDLFPRLAERRTQAGGSLSGGEQQMLAIGRALMMQPELLLLDEPSLGLAPSLIDAVFAALKRINDELGTTMLIVEQNANLALGISNYAYVLEAGEIVEQGAAEKLRNDDSIRKAYLGV